MNFVWFSYDSRNTLINVQISLAYYNDVYITFIVCFNFSL